VRSISALGMIEVLWREGLYPDLIVGCSAGAMFGALIATGHDAAEGLEVAMQLWSRDITRRHRWMAIPQMLMPRLGFDADFALRDDSVIMERLEQAFGDTRIEDLRLPLRVTATDAGSGQTVVLKSGNLVEALRASIAMPFMFSPVLIDGLRLIDGFVSDPLPVSAAGDAQTVLAMGFPAPMPKRIDRPSRLLGQVTSAMTNNLMQARLAATQGDGMRLVTVFPKLERRVGLFDTDAMPYLVQAGRLAAEDALPEIMGMLNRNPRLAVA
jgi:NTE family protein